MSPLNSPKNKISDLKLSTLTHAAKISHLVNETTIGPSSKSPTSKTPQTIANSYSIAPSKTPFSQSKWRTDAWRSVPFSNDEDDDDNNNITRSEKSHTNQSIISLIDCKAASFKMALKSAEKSRVLRVRQEIRDHHSKYDEISAMMEQLKVVSNEHATITDKLAQEEELIEAVRRLDEEARHCEEQTKQELLAHNRRMTEFNNHLKRDEEVHECCEQIKSFKNMFIMMFERYVKTILLNQQQLTRFDEYTMYQGQFLERYESVINNVNSGHISQAEVVLLEQLCEEIKEVHQAVDEEISQNAEELEKIMAADKAEAAARMQQAAAELERQQQEAVELQQMLAQQEQAQQEQVQQPPLPTLSGQFDNVDGTNKVSVLQSFVSAERLQSYEQIMAFYEQYAQSVKPLQADENMKKYRFNCQKAVNTPLNAISATSPQHLLDKFDKLSLLLSGSSVRVGDVNISSSDHPLGVRFCTLLVAKKLVVSLSTFVLAVDGSLINHNLLQNQADSIVSSNPQSAFPIASIMVAIWQKFPDTGYLFLAYLYKECPYLVPYFIPQLQGQTTEEYFKQANIFYNFTV